MGGSALLGGRRRLGRAAPRAGFLASAGRSALAAASAEPAVRSRLLGRARARVGFLAGAGASAAACASAAPPAGRGGVAAASCRRPWLARRLGRRFCRGLAAGAATASYEVASPSRRQAACGPSRRAASPQARAEPPTTARSTSAARCTRAAWRARAAILRPRLLCGGRLPDRLRSRLPPLLRAVATVLPECRSWLRRARAVALAIQGRLVCGAIATATATARAPPIAARRPAAGRAGDARRAGTRALPARS